MGAHRSYLAFVGQIRPTEITFISMSFNSSSQKYTNFRVHTYPPMEVNPFHTDCAASVQSETHAAPSVPASCFLLTSPPSCSSCPSGVRRPPTGASSNGPARQCVPHPTALPPTLPGREGT
jgi:hypothetical protein